MSGRLGIIAGGGQLPIILAQDVSLTQPPFVVRLAGFADAALNEHSGDDINIGAIGATVAALRAAGCDRVVFAGAVSRPDFATVELDETGRAHFPELLEAAQRGDDALLAALVEIIAEQGFEVVGAHEVCPRLLCPTGVVAGGAPNPKDSEDLRKGYRIARLIGQEDIGQACVVAGGLVLALEAQEGTDGMLRRVSELPEAIRGSDANRRGVLVKCAKPQQERRIDLPVIGVETVQNAASAGLAGIGLEAGSCLIVDREAVQAEALRHGIFVVGLDNDPSAVTS
ncbi:MAG: UDP-2,3-diacylglucosamine diphosphatase LpxI [Hyphomonadaceae bacterium]